MELELSSLKNAVHSLGKALQIINSKIVQENVSSDEIDLLRAGVIQNFEFTYELSWKFMKRWIENNVAAEIVDGVTRKELFRIAIENRLISDIDEWMEFHRARNISAHTYDDKTAEVVYRVAVKFLDYAKALLQGLESRND